jgi:phosphopantetheinyl transferase (holo-ACP synthase)
MSIGNDIIDLNFVNKERTRLYNFYSKILSPSEQQLYQSVETKMALETYVWLLWSVKESLYKYLKRHQPSLVFSPTGLISTSLIPPERRWLPSFSIVQMEQKGLDIDVSYHAAIQFEDAIYQTSSLITNEFIHTIAYGESSVEPIYWGLKRIEDRKPANQSVQVRSFALKKLNNHFPNLNLVIEKSEVGYPFVVADQTGLPVNLSFSHHGHFVAYAFAEIPGTDNSA